MEKIPCVIFRYPNPHNKSLSLHRTWKPAGRESISPGVDSRLRPPSVPNKRHRRHQHQQQQQRRQRPAKLRPPCPSALTVYIQYMFGSHFQISPGATRSAVPSVTSDPAAPRIFTIPSIYNVTSYCFFYGLCCDASGPETCVGGWVG